MSGKWHLICCLFCCSTLAVINLCPLLLFFFFLYIYFCSTHLHSLVLVHYQCFIINVYSIIYCLTTRRHVYIFNLCIILLNCVIEWGWLRINHSTLIAAANWVNNNCNNNNNNSVSDTFGPFSCVAHPTLLHTQTHSDTYLHKLSSEWAWRLKRVAWRRRAQLIRLRHSMCVYLVVYVCVCVYL